MKEKLLLLLFVMVTSMGASIAQTVQVRGVVISEEDGEPVIGASVLVKGTTIGSITDFEGKFELANIPPSAKTLVVSYVGMITQEVAIRTGNLRIVLKSDSQTLDEILVVAYGTTKRSAFTGSASVVGQDKLMAPGASFDKALAGKVAGVQVVSSSGQPGSGTSFRIRGSGSLKASNEPLYVIDGVAVSSYTGEEYSEIAEEGYSDGNIMSSINPNDIESVTILKDAAAAALYGSRAANGVVLITTKSGKSGKAKVTLNAQYSWATLGKAYKTMSSEQYYKHLFGGYLRSGSDVNEANEKTQGAITHNPYNVAYPLDASGNVVSGARIVVDTDWQDAIFSTAGTQDYNVSVSGGTDKTDYLFSVGYTDQDGIAPAGNFKRYSGKMNLNSEVSSWLKTGMNATFSHSIQNTTIAGSAGASPLYNALLFPNGVPIYIVDTDGNPVLDASNNKQYNFTNPVSLDFNPLAIPFMDVNRSKFYRALVSAYADVKLWEGLNFKTVFSGDYFSTDEHRYWNKEHGNGPAYGGRLDKYHHTDLSYTSTNTLNYKNVFADVHSVNVMAGMEYWKSTFETLYAGGTDLLGDMQELSAAGSAFSPASKTTEETLISYFGRVEYAFADKYNLSASLRSDGSSVFGSDNKWGTFWSVGASWRMKEENFLKDVDYLDNLKLRLSYGTSGNKTGLARYASLGLWTASPDYLYGSNKGVGHEQLANALLSWEKQGMFNVGVDFGFLNKIYGSIDYFYKTSDGLLYDFPLAISNGFENIALNAAKTANSGFEFVIGADILTGPFRWNVDFNASIIKDEIKDLNGDDNVQVAENRKVWSIGGSQYEFYMPTWAGVDAQTGSPMWYVVDDNGNRTTTNTYSNATYEKQGRSTPDVFGGLTNTFSYKNFDLSIQLNYTIGGKFYDGLYANIMHDGSQVGTNLHVDALKAWSSAGQHTEVPLFAPNNSSGSSSLSSRFLYNATNLKVKNITLSYNLPKRLGLISGVVSNAKVWLSVDNVCTWFTDSDYKGYDDIDIYGVQGYRLYPTIPMPRTFTLGANLTF